MEEWKRAIDGLHMARSKSGWRVWRGDKLVASIMLTSRGQPTYCWHDVSMWELYARDLVIVAPRGWESV